MHKNQTVYYKFIGGSDSGLADNEKGVMTIVNDFGATYNYRTVAVSPSAFRGNQDVREIQFQDLPDGYACETYYPLRLAIPDGAFKGCKNLKALNMYYYVTKGSNHYETLGPENVYIGKDVFDGCADDFTIRVAPERLQDFLANPDWARYKDRIRAWEYAPVDASSITEKGVEYDYAATLVNNLPNDKVIKMRYSLLNLPVLALRVAIETALLNAGVGPLTDLIGLTEGAFEDFATYWAMDCCIDYGASIVGAVCDRMGQDGLGSFLEYLISATCSSLESVSEAEEAISESVMRGLVMPWANSVAEDQVYNMLYLIPEELEKTVLARLATENTLGNTKDVQATTFEDKQLDLIGETNDYPDVSSIFSWWNEQYTRTPYVIYKMYVKSLGNLPGGEMKIYNDIGTLYNYRTVAIGETAAKGNRNLKSITFADCASKTAESYVPLRVMVPDHAFDGCENLESLNMFIYMDHEANQEFPLGPGNFRLLGSHVFDGCPKLKIRIARDKLPEFLADSIWSRYSDRFEAVDWAEPVKFSERGCNYTHNLTDNSLLDKDDDSVWGIHVSGPSDDKHEEIDIAVDPGTFKDYHTTYVAKKAFCGYTPLKKIHFWDMTTNLVATNANRDVEIKLQDSCFADCKNLREVCMMYHTYEGINGLSALSPQNITLGKGVFDGCPDDFKILVAAEYYADFLTDPYWMEYARHIVPFYFKPENGTADLLADGCDKYDGYDLCDYRIPTRLVDNGKLDDVSKERVSQFKNYALFSCADGDNASSSKAISDRQFAGMSNLTDIYIPYTVERVGANAFEGTALRRILFSKNMTSIGAGAFKDCAHLKTVELHCDNPSAVSIDATAFDGVEEDYVITVPDSLVGAYKAQLPQYAGHINGLSAFPAKTGLVTVNAKKVGDLIAHFGITTKLTSELAFNSDLSIYPCIMSEGNGQWRDVDSLKVVGPIDQADYMLMLKMASKRFGCLKYLDLSDARMQYHKFSYTNTKDETFDVDVTYEAPNGKMTLIGEDYDTYTIKSVDDDSGRGLRSFAIDGELPLGQLQTVLWSDDYFGSSVDASSSFGKIIFPENFAGFKHPSGFLSVLFSPQLPNTVFLGNTLPSSVFLREESATTNLYVPYSGNTTYRWADNYGGKAASVNSLFKDDEAFRVITRSTLDVTENELAAMPRFGTWFKDNTKVKNLDDLVSFSSITDIPAEAFSGCSSLERVAIPISVSHIGSDAFKGCASLSSITMVADSVPTLDGEDTAAQQTGMFADLPADFRIYVTDNMLEKYLSNPQWAKYRRHIVSYQQTDELKTVTLTQPGQLAAALGLEAVVEDGRLAAVNGPGIGSLRRMKVSGPITDVDIALLHYLTGCSPSSGSVVDDAQLRYLDLADANVVKPTGSPCKVADNSGAYVDNDN